jgi:rhamnosyltransferase subunit B
MRFLLLPLGTYGDVKPYLEIGTALKQRGHDVVIGTAEPFRETVKARGIAYEPILNRIEHSRCLADPELWHRRLFFRAFARGFIVPSIKPILDLVKKQPKPMELTILASFSGSFGARVAQELTGARLISLWVDPAAVRSSIAPPVISGLEFLPSLPPFLRKIVFWFMDRSADLVLAGPLNQIRRELGLSPVRSVLQWMVSKYRSLCLFPAWYAPVQRDWPTDSRTVGFPLVVETHGLPENVQKFLDSGAPPIVVTFGTGITDSMPEFYVAVEACRRLGERALVLAHPGALSSESIPEGSALFENRPPFATLLPRARAIIHHGGMGTLAQSLAAGLPQLVIPLAHDQPDNAARLKRLGAGVGISRRHFTVNKAVAGLKQVLSPETQRICQSLAAKISKENGIEQACLALEEW